VKWDVYSGFRLLIIFRSGSVDLGPGSINNTKEEGRKKLLVLPFLFHKFEFENIRNKKLK
jgi:hypothetical protein